jgi:hypothetical protein
MSQVVVGVAQNALLGLPDQSDSRWLAMVSGVRASYLGAICSQFSLTEAFEKILLVSEDGHVASMTG